MNWSWVAPQFTEFKMKIYVFSGAFDGLLRFRALSQYNLMKNCSQSIKLKANKSSRAPCNFDVNTHKYLIKRLNEFCELLVKSENTCSQFY